QDMKDAGARRVGALDDPGEERAHHECRRRRAESKDHGIPEQSRNVPTRISLDKIIKRQTARSESGIFGEGVVKERRERNKDEPKPRRKNRRTGGSLTGPGRPANRPATATPRRSSRRPLAVLKQRAPIPLPRRESGKEKRNSPSLEQLIEKPLPFALLV